MLKHGCLLDAMLNTAPLVFILPGALTSLHSSALPLSKALSFPRLCAASCVTTSDNMPHTAVLLVTRIPFDCLISPALHFQPFCKYACLLQDQPAALSVQNSSYQAAYANIATDLNPLLKLMESAIDAAGEHALDLDICG